MKSARKHGAILISGGILAILSLSLPWANGISLLQILAVIEVQGAFPSVPLSIAGTESHLLAVYSTFYAVLLGSAFLIAIGLLQFASYREEYRWIRLLSLALYAGAVLSAVHYPAYPPRFGGASYGFFIFLTPLVLFVCSEYRFEDGSSIQSVRDVLSQQRLSRARKTDNDGSETASTTDWKSTTNNDRKNR